MLKDDLQRCACESEFDVGRPRDRQTPVSEGRPDSVVSDRYFR